MVCSCQGRVNFNTSAFGSPYHGLTNGYGITYVGNTLCGSRNGFGTSNGCTTNTLGSRYNYTYRCCGSARGPNRTGCTYCNCYKNRTNYTSYVINGSYTGRNATRAAFYSNCNPR